MYDKWTHGYIMYEYFPVIRDILKPNTLQLNMKLSTSPHHFTHQLHFTLHSSITGQTSFLNLIKPVFLTGYLKLDVTRMNLSWLLLQAKQTLIQFMKK